MEMDLRRRLDGRSRQGFTLLEMLVVVAIIAVLVAIAIPVFSGQLARARLATDQANVRSAKAAAAAEYMSDGASGSVSYLYAGGKAVPTTSGNLNSVSSLTSGKGYGQSEASANTHGETGASGTPKDGYVIVTVNGDSAQQITATWSAGAVVMDGTSGTLTLTGGISNTSIMAQVQSLGIDPSQVTSIKAAEHSKIDSNTEKVFSGLQNLKSIDLSGAELENSSQYMFSDMPDSVTQITLPKASKPYNIAGVWYYADGTREGSKWSNGLNENTGTRIETGHNGVTIYKAKPSGK